MKRLIRNIVSKFKKFIEYTRSYIKFDVTNIAYEFYHFKRKYVETTRLVHKKGYYYRQPEIFYGDKPLWWCMLYDNSPLVNPSEHLSGKVDIYDYENYPKTYEHFQKKVEKENIKYKELRKELECRFSEIGFDYIPHIEEVDGKLIVYKNKTDKFKPKPHKVSHYVNRHTLLYSN